jgi:hypothetical protein
MDEQLGIHKKTLICRNLLRDGGVFATVVLAVYEFAASILLLYPIPFVVSGAEVCTARWTAEYLEAVQR